jgi:hypothetical protein
MTTNIRQPYPEYTTPETYKVREYSRYKHQGRDALDDFSDILRLVFPGVTLETRSYRPTIGNVRFTVHTDGGFSVTRISSIGLETYVGETVRRLVKRKGDTISLTDLRAKYEELERIFAERNPEHQERVNEGERRQKELEDFRAELGASHWSRAESAFGELVGDENLKLYRTGEYGQGLFNLEFKNLTADKVRQIVRAYQSYTTPLD